MEIIGFNKYLTLQKLNNCRHWNVIYVVQQYRDLNDFALIILYLYYVKKKIKIEQKSFYYNLILLYTFVLLLFKTLWKKSNIEQNILCRTQLYLQTILS